MRSVPLSLGILLVSTSAVAQEPGDKWFIVKDVSIDRGEAPAVDLFRAAVIRILDSDEDRLRILTDTQQAGWIPRDAALPPDKALQQADEILEQGEEPFVGWFLRATVLRQTGRNAQAVNAYTRAVELQPDNVNVRLGRGLAFQDIGQLDESLQDLDKVIELDPLEPGGWINRSLVWSLRGEPDREIEDLNRAAELQPEWAVIYNNRGTAWQTLGDLDQAEKDLRHSLELSADFALARTNLGVLLIERRSYPEALEELSQSIRLNPGDARAWAERARARSLAGNKAEAAEDYTAALERRPDHPLYLLRRASVLMDLDRLDDAASDLERRRELVENDADGANDLGVVRLRQGLTQEAAELFEEALRVDPDAALALHNLAGIRREAGAAGEAARLLTRALNVAPDNVDAINRRALCWQQLGDLELAVSDFARSLRVDGQQPGVLARRGALLRSLGRLDEAEQQLTLATEMDADLIDAWYERALLYERMGRPAAAAGDYARVYEAAPESIQLLINYAWLLATTSTDDVRDGDLAKKLALEGCELTSYDDPDLLEDLAAAHAELGSFEDAVKWQEQAVEKFEDEDTANQARERLQLYRDGKPFRR